MRGGLISDTAVTNAAAPVHVLFRSAAIFALVVATAYWLWGVIQQRRAKRERRERRRAKKRR